VGLGAGLDVLAKRQLFVPAGIRTAIAWPSSPLPGEGMWKEAFVGQLRCGYNPGILLEGGWSLSWPSSD
jgi:hypothetical protein